MSLLTLNEAAERLRVSYWTAWEMAKKGEIPTHRFEGRRRILVDEDELNACIAAQKTGPETGPNESHFAPNTPKLAQFKQGQHSDYSKPYEWRQRVRRGR